jgi:1,4-alpha-glucan branching enzyme
MYPLRHQGLRPKRQKHSRPVTTHRVGSRIGFPGSGEWREVFNSDVYENWVNPDVAGNGGRVVAQAESLHGFGHSAALVLPANAILVLAR